MGRTPHPQPHHGPFLRRGRETRLDAPSSDHRYARSGFARSAASLSPEILMVILPDE